jgi:hypothetical protein
MNRHLKKRLAALLLLPALLLSGPTAVYRCDKKCTVSDEAARFCMRSQANQQADFISRHGDLPWLAENGDCMGVGSFQACFVTAPQVKAPPLPAVFLAQEHSTAFFSSASRTPFSGLDPPGSKPFRGLAAVPSQHAPPVGRLFS